MDDVVMWEYRAEWYPSMPVYRKGFAEAIAESWEPYLMAGGAGAVQVIYRRAREVPEGLTRDR
jgi:hypothetical protein